MTAVKCIAFFDSLLPQGRSPIIGKSTNFRLDFTLYFTLDYILTYITYLL